MTRRIRESGFHVVGTRVLRLGYGFLHAHLGATAHIVLGRSLRPLPPGSCSDIKRPPTREVVLF